MGQTTRRFNGKEKIVGKALLPACKGVIGRPAIESAVDLDGCIVRKIVVQTVIREQFMRIVLQLEI